MKKKSFIAVILSLVMGLNILFGTMAQAAELNISSQGACVMDYYTGEVLYERNGNVPRVPASMTKIMNMYCIYEALRNREITLNTVVPISKNVYEKSRNSVYQSVLPLYYDKTYTVDEMMDIIVVYSASGAAVAMAELIGGTEENFVARMNKKAKEMGIDAYYYDSCGIAKNQISPIGMATLARNIIRDFPNILTRSAQSSVYFHGKTYKTTNHLLDTYYYEGADGLKTGTTSAAGYCFCGTAIRNGRRMISVTMSSSSTGQRFIDTAKLLDYGFSVADTLPTAESMKNKEEVKTEDVKLPDENAVTEENAVTNEPVAENEEKEETRREPVSINKENLNAVTGLIGELMQQEREPSKPILPNGEELTSGSAFIMDFETGNELYSFRANEQKAVASIAKMMSIYVVLDAIKNGEITLDTIVPISENVYNLSRNENYKMMVNLHYDEVYTVEEMIDMIIIFSSAACVTAVSELLCGSEAEFVKRMNAKAQEIGIDSVFYNGTGVCLNPEVDKENLMSAREVAIMTKKMIEDYPEVLEKTKCASVDFHGKTYYNLNKLFTDFYYEGADGFKNGMTEASGYCMCGTAEVDGKRVITVTLPSNSNEARFTDSIKMFNYGLGLLGVDTTHLTEKPEEGFNITNIEDVKVNIDGNYEMKFTKSIIAKDGTVLVPVRELMETLEKTVSWDNDIRAAVVKDDVTQIKLKMDDASMTLTVTNPLDNTVSTSEIKLNSAPVLVDGVAYMPVEAVEAFGAAVIWEEDTQTVLIIAGVC